MCIDWKKRLYCALIFFYAYITNIFIRRRGREGENDKIEIGKNVKFLFFFFTCVCLIDYYIIRTRRSCAGTSARLI